MSDHSRAVLASRIHQPGCPWSWTAECTDAIAAHRQIDSEAIDILVAQASRAFRFGVPPTENTNQAGSRSASHRCPVGERVLELDDHGFTPKRPMPWTGELYAQSSDNQTLLRLYFIERREDSNPPTNEIIGCGLGRKPVSADNDWTSKDQTRDILRAMNSGIERCENVGSVWRRWNTA